MSKKVFYSIVAILISLIVILSGMLIRNYAPKRNTKSPTPITQKSPTISLQQNNCSAAGEVNITLITDSLYTTPTRVSMLSAIKTKCPNSIYNFYIITENTTKEDNAALLRLKQLVPETVNIKLIAQKEPDLPFENMQRFIQYKVGMHKIYLPQILKELDKVIYMDGDTVVLKDLLSLYNIDVTGVYAAVAKDGIYYRFPKEMEELGFTKRGFYFNSGVMLYNLKMQREDNITAKMIDYINNNSDFFGDQDVLNIVFGDKLRLMTYRNNCISTFFEADDLGFLSTYFGEELPKNTFDIYQNATIIHYAGDKPWSTIYKPQFLKDLWFSFYKEVEGL